MRIPAVALLIVIGLPPCSTSDLPGGPTGTFVVDNGASVDVLFQLTVAGKRLPGCFWVLHGRSTAFELPRGRLDWSYSSAGTQFTGSTQIAPGRPKMVSCRTAQARLTGDVAQCEPAIPPDALPPNDAGAALSGKVLGSLQDLALRLEQGDEAGVAELIEPPFEVAGGERGPRRVKNARQLLEVRAQLELDAKALAAAKARGGDARTGEGDCAKNAVDWSKGDPALSCDGHEVTVALSSSACSPRVNTWKLRNSGPGWVLVGKGSKTR